MITKLKALFSVLQAGNQVANPAAWKNRQIAANSILALIAALVALSAAFGMDLQLQREDLEALAGGIAAAYGIFNTLCTVATSKKVGFPAATVAQPKRAAGRPKKDKQVISSPQSSLDG